MNNSNFSELNFIHLHKNHSFLQSRTQRKSYFDENSGPLLGNMSSKPFQTNSQDKQVSRLIRKYIKQLIICIDEVLENFIKFG